MGLQLVKLPEIERLSPLCIRILGGNPSKFTLQGTNTYLVGKGPRRILIDTGEGKPSWIAAIKATLDQEEASIDCALITHWHHDHQGGIRDLQQLSPTTKIYKNNPQDGQLGISDGQTFAVDGVSLEAVHTPGHTVDHMAFIIKEEDAIFTGDNVLGQGTAVFEDLSTYLNSLERMRPLCKGRGYPGHGPVIPDAQAKIVEYINHRKLREEQVLRTMRSGRGDGQRSTGWSVMELVMIIYRDVPESLHVPASGGISQILVKLEKEGAVSQKGEEWMLTNRSAL